MRVITRRRLREFADAYPDASDALFVWLDAARQAEWHSIVDVRERFPHADLVAQKVVFNIRGNTYRLITAIHFNRGIVFVREFLTHAEYDRGTWKDR